MVYEISYTTFSLQSWEDYMSNQAFYKRNGNTFTISTGKIEKCIQLTDGRLTVSNLKNLNSNKEYIWNAPIPMDEFYITVNDKKLSGSYGNWKLNGVDERRLSQNELEVCISIANDIIEVCRHYIAYPGEPVIQEWTEYRNITNSVINVDEPSIFVVRSIVENCLETDFSYMTGGANFTGSQMFKTVPLTSRYNKFFDSQKDPEVIEVEGIKCNTAHERYNGCGMWNEFFVLTNRKEKQGYYLTFDYQGTWKGYISNTDNNSVLTAYCDIHDYKINPGDALKIAPMTFGLYEGDYDDLGNTINDYIYTYKWDYTREQYFNRTNMNIWKAAPLNDKVFQMIQYATYIGYERIWVDDFWFDAKGNWNPVWGDDWAEANRYMKAHGMKFRLWMPPYHADRLSKVWHDHPDWMLDFHGNWYNWTIDMSKEEAYQWVLHMLCDKQQQYGSYDLRVDGDPCNLAGNNATDQVSQNGNWNCTLKQSENFYRLYKEFKDFNPDAGIDGCSSGGHTLGIESARYCDQQQITDGWCLHYGGYYTSMILPIDKHQGMPIAGTSRADSWHNVDDVILDLFQAPINGMQNPELGTTPEVLEKRRQHLEKFYWLRKLGIYGRYIKVFRPEVEHADKTYILQRMTWDSKRGLIMISANPNNPMLGKSERIMIKGLSPEEEYYIDSELGSVTPETKTGKEWMEEGVFLSKVEPGEYVYINIPNRAGMPFLADKPESPLNLSKKDTEFMRHSGVAVTWEIPTNSENISYFQIFKNHEALSKVSIGTLYFDTVGKLNDIYGVQSVDYSGNHSEIIEI